MRSNGGRVREFAKLLACLAAFLFVAIGVDTAQAGQGEFPAKPQFLSDFDEFCRQLSGEYAYFAKKRISWAKACELYRPRAAAASSRRELLHVLEDVIAELYDDHATLGADAAGSPNIVPSRTDLWGSFHGDAAIIDEVRPGSVAAVAGVRNGDEVVAIGELPVDEAVTHELPHTLVAADPKARDWALRRALAGRRGEARELSVRHTGGATERIHLAEQEHPPTTEGLLEARTLADGIGYIRFHNSLGEEALVSAFDDALARMKDAPAILLDLRDTPGGGNNQVAEAILGRFIRRTVGYQRFVIPARGSQRERSFVQKVHPRGPFTYRGRLVVLVDHWTASMAEGMASGLSAMKRAVLVGTAMAGLNGGVYTQLLGVSGIAYNYPAERIYTMDGTPREEVQPQYKVAVSDERDAILERSVELARRH